jgi:para-nitrobenzyl esterase
MTKAAIILILIAILVIIGANFFLKSQVAEETPPPVPDKTTLRNTTSGDVVGFRDRYGARAWLGIPFAAAPVKDQRWRAPATAPTHDAVFEAIAAGNLCPQFASLLSGAGPDFQPGSVAGDEDCLYLNIWSPPNAAGLPVMFWIHGGGNSIGHGGSYSGAALAANREVVVVTINYRLGIFGWFSHPGLATNNPLHDSGNYGLLDIIAALQWVQDNVAEFGGNPENVTVFGESAGATDTLAVMASPLAGGLFHRAIVQSGGYRTTAMQIAQNFADQGGHDFSSAEIVNNLILADGLAKSREEAKTYQADMSRGQLREYLYSKPAAEYFNHLDGGGFGMISFPQMFADGHVLPDLSAEEVFSNPDNHNMVPTILGTNRDEPAIFMVRNPEYVDTWLGFLPRLKDEAHYKRVVKYGALAWKERGVDSLAQYMTQAGNKNVYAYRFDWDEEPSQFGFDLSTALGAAHGLEIAFAFGEFDGGMGIGYVYPGDDAQFSLADSMTSYWSEFAYSGSPGKGREGQQVLWQPWGQNGKTSIILDSPADQGIFMDDAIVTTESIKAELAADGGFSNPLDQCAIYARNFRGEAFDQSEYEALNPTCAQTNPSSFAGF